MHGRTVTIRLNHYHRQVRKKRMNYWLKEEKKAGRDIPKERQKNPTKQWLKWWKRHRAGTAEMKEEPNMFRESMS